MNPKEQEDSAFDRSADAQLRRIEKALSGFDPDELDAYLGGDVLTITLGNGQKIIINRHRAARQIWMAALRRAWHFDPAPAGTWRTAKPAEKSGDKSGDKSAEKSGDKSGDKNVEAELITTLEEVLTQQLGRPIHLDEARGPRG